MGWILLLIIIIVIIAMIINSRSEKKKQHKLWEERQKDSYVPPLAVTSLESVDGAHHIEVKNDDGVYFTQYEDGKTSWPGGVENFSLYFDKDTNHLKMLSYVQDGDTDFGEVDPKATEKFLEVYQSMGGHIAEHYELLTLNKVDSGDLNLSVKEFPAKVYIYTEKSATDGKKRIYFSPDPTSTAYKLLGVAVSDASDGNKSIDLSLEDANGVQGSIYTTLSEEGVEDLQNNFK